MHHPVDVIGFIHEHGTCAFVGSGNDVISSAKFTYSAHVLSAKRKCFLALLYVPTLTSHTVQARARNKSHLAVLEAVYIAKLKPELCVQKKYVRKLSLF